MLPVALDQALEHTGWAILFSDSVWVGEHRTKPSTPLLDRLLSLEALVDQFQQLGADQFITENIFGSRQPLVQVQTTLHLAFHRRGLPFNSISAHPRQKASWRHPLHLNGDKQEVIDWAERVWGAKVNSHEADALGILCGWALHQKLDVDPRTLPLQVLHLAPPARIESKRLEP